MLVDKIVFNNAIEINKLHNEKSLPTHYKDDTKVNKYINNIDNSDGTLLFLYPPSIISCRIINYCITGKWVDDIKYIEPKEKFYKPFYITYIDYYDIPHIKKWISTNNIKILNICGSSNISKEVIEKYLLTLLNK